MTPTLNVIYSLTLIATLTKIVCAYTENEPQSISARNLITKTYIKQITAQNKCLWKYVCVRLACPLAWNVQRSGAVNCCPHTRRATDSDSTVADDRRLSAVPK